MTGFDLPRIFYGEGVFAVEPQLKLALLYSNLIQMCIWAVFSIRILVVYDHAPLYYWGPALYY